MSTNATASSSYRSRQAEGLAAYLRAAAERTGGLYVNEASLAEEVGLSPKETGALLVELRGSVPGLAIERCPDASAAAWRVSAV